MVQIVDEEVQRFEALLQPGGDGVPLFGRDGAGHDVEQPGAVDIALFGVDRKTDPHLLNGNLRHLAAGFDLLERQGFKVVDQLPGGGANGAVPAYQFIKIPVGVIRFPVHRHSLTYLACGSDARCWCRCVPGMRTFGAPSAWNPGSAL